VLPSTFVVGKDRARNLTALKSSRPRMSSCVTDSASLEAAMRSLLGSTPRPILCDWPVRGGHFGTIIDRFCPGRARDAGGDRQRVLPIPNPTAAGVGSAAESTRNNSHISRGHSLI
jgi:hypothetical protein